ncbi:MAG: hypothetical protein PHV74_00310 [Dehalococcoidia bacterium]|nr:hypothetical protein [Dehalococcoidia bacterium]
MPEKKVIIARAITYLDHHGAKKKINAFDMSLILAYLLDEPKEALLDELIDYRAGRISQAEGKGLNEPADEVPQEVRIIIEGGLVQSWSVPDGIRVVVKDFDTDGADDDVVEEDGDVYRKSILEGEG